MTEAVQTVAPKLAKAALAVAAASLLLLVLVQAWQVLARYLLNASPGWTEPLSVLCLSTAMSLAAASAVAEQAHFAFPLLRDAAPSGLRRLLMALAHVVVVMLSVFIALGAAQLARDGWDIPTAGLGLPQGLRFVPVALGGVMMAFCSVLHVLALREKVD